MKPDVPRLPGEFKRLFRSMGFVSRHPALNGHGKEAERFADIYQQLGALWEFLALQCPHRAGWRTTRDKRHVCRLCGTISDAEERWHLLPRRGRQVIGRRREPTSRETFSNKRTATVVNEILEFHGAKLTVDVHNSYRSRLLRDSKFDITVAAERTVRIEEAGVECSFSGSQVRLRLKKHQRGERPPFGAFVAELPKRALRKFPLLVEFTPRGELVGVDIFLPLSSKKRVSRKAG